MSFNEVLKKHIEEAENMIEPYIPKVEGPQAKVIEAMRYSVVSGGKRLRPMLMLECFKLCRGNMNSGVIAPFMAAMEMVHTYSLIHDDLPCMDNDEYRRGNLTTWKKYGEEVGVLAGDGLLNYAFETALKAYENAIFDVRIASALRILANKAGIYGMIGGQTIDVLNEGRELDQEQLRLMYKWKTGALIEASMTIGGTLAGASDKQVQMLEDIAEDIGLAFQVQDDILDVTSTSEKLGKPVGSDIKNDKATYVSLFGLEESKACVSRLINNVMNKLTVLEAEYPEYDAEFLNNLINWLIYREI